MAVTRAGQLAAPAAGPGLTAGVRGWLRTAGEWLARQNRRSAATTVGAPIGPAGRVLTTGRDLAGSPVVATSAAVYIQDRGGPGRAWSGLAVTGGAFARGHARRACRGCHVGSRAAGTADLTVFPGPLTASLGGRAAQMP
jgi:hypothetical protein